MAIIDEKTLDQILKNTMQVMEESKTQIFEIYEGARNEVICVQNDIDVLKETLETTIKKVDELTALEKQSRQRLMDVSGNFKTYTEADIKLCYDQTKDLQVRLAVMHEQEQNLIKQRNDLEIRLRKLQKTAEKAKQLVAQVGVVLGYLTAQFSAVASKMESVHQDKLFAPLVIKAQEDERLRVSREIHDGPAQLMANVIYRSSACERLIDKDIEKAKEELRELREQIRICLSETRKIIFDLRPMTLDDLGLIATIHYFINKLEQRVGLTVDFNVIGAEAKVASHIEISLFRVIQEALNNVHKHAAVDHAKVVIEYNSEYISVVIEDAGQGFNLNEVDSTHRESDCYGLLGMEERVKILKGQMIVDSKAFQGTKIRVLVPLVDVE
ncbi:sensor histidine kinase [Anaerosinus massiliensis]|uniref:sensor histidine kinase n=1 Tax=Massilibacillus massiliensis TaxID=1806837 RepID=UPI000B0150E0|nr:sensor histidine kinase [Massilibacillus massiliensis]